MLHVCILSSRGIFGQSWSVPVGCLSGSAACSGGVCVQLIDPYQFVQATIFDMQSNMFAKVVWWGLVVCALACFIVGVLVAILSWPGRSGVHLKSPSYEL